MQRVKSAKDERYGPDSATFRDLRSRKVAESGPYLSSLADVTRCIFRSWPLPDAVIKVIYAPDDGWSYHPKHVEQFTEI
jgi:hypothetical protein